MIVMSNNTQKEFTKLYKTLALPCTIAVVLYWVIVGNTNVYAYKLTGALSELLWLPMLMLPLLLIIATLTYIVMLVANNANKP